MEIGRTTPADYTRLRDEARLAGKTLVPVSIRLLDYGLTPVGSYLSLKRNGGPSFVFESVESSQRAGRWSFVGVHTRRGFTARGDQYEYTRHEPEYFETGGYLETGNDVRAKLAVLLKADTVVSTSDLPPFTGGWVGRFGYDAVRLIEPTVPDTNPDDLNVPDIDLMFFDQILAFDNVDKLVHLIELLPVEPQYERQSYARAMTRLNELKTRLMNGLCASHFEIPMRPTAHTKTASTTQAVFEAMARKALGLIRAGDIFQVVLSLRLCCELGTTPLGLYCCLRHTNPSPHHFLIDFGSYQVVGASPEIMVNVINREVHLRPIAGTRRRGATPEEDAALKRELLSDPKERAEHIMLVDLGRNDAGRVCKPGTVTIGDGEFMYVNQFSSVQHLVTDVRGELRDDLEPLDALWAAFPAGTLSGAPKVRAMQIIDELENLRRGPYGGCVGFLGCNGNIETAIMIRAATCQKRSGEEGGFVYWQVGAGIVADSDPASEYEECLRKAGAIEGALKLAEQIAQAAKETR